MLEGATIDGFETVAFCEIEDFPRRVLAKHWPVVPCYRDVRELTGARLAADGIAVDVICGGFPCQDISTAGNGAGLAGERSGLWSEIARLVSELAPRFVIVENVAALLHRGLADVLGDLASVGYDAEWHCIPASAIGALHQRDRVWIIAYPKSDGRTGSAVGNQDGNAAAAGKVELRIESAGSRAVDVAGALANAISTRQPRSGALGDASDPAAIVQRQAVDAFNGRFGNIWRTEPALGRVANGVPDRAHRLKALGNAVVPQIPELIGNAILASLNQSPTFRRGCEGVGRGAGTLCCPAPAYSEHHAKALAGMAA